MRQLPHSVLGLIEQLEADYPPRCKSPDESLEAHGNYAGKVELTKLLRDRFDAVTKKEKGELTAVLNPDTSIKL